MATHHWLDTPDRWAYAYKKEQELREKLAGSGTGTGTGGGGTGTGGGGGNWEDQLVSMFNGKDNLGRPDPNLIFTKTYGTNGFRESWYPYIMHKLGWRMYHESDAWCNAHPWGWNHMFATGNTTQTSSTLGKLDFRKTTTDADGNTIPVFKIRLPYMETPSELEGMVMYDSTTAKSVLDEMFAQIPGNDYLNQLKNYIELINRDTTDTAIMKYLIDMGITLYLAGLTVSDSKFHTSGTISAVCDKLAATNYPDARLRFGTTEWQQWFHDNVDSSFAIRDDYTNIGSVGKNSLISDLTTYFSSPIYLVEPFEVWCYDCLYKEYRYSFTYFLSLCKSDIAAIMGGSAYGELFLFSKSWYEALHGDVPQRSDVMGIILNYGGATTNWNWATMLRAWQIQGGINGQPNVSSSETWYSYNFRNLLRPTKETSTSAARWMYNPIYTTQHMSVYSGDLKIQGISSAPSPIATNNSKLRPVLDGAIKSYGLDEFLTEAQRTAIIDNRPSDISIGSSVFQGQFCASGIAYTFDRNTLEDAGLNQEDISSSGTTSGYSHHNTLTMFYNCCDNPISLGSSSVMDTTTSYGALFVNFGWSRQSCAWQAINPEMTFSLFKELLSYTEWIRLTRQAKGNYVTQAFLYCQLFLTREDFLNAKFEYLAASSNSNLYPYINGVKVSSNSYIAAKDSYKELLTVMKSMSIWDIDPETLPT